MNKRVKEIKTTIEIEWQEVLENISAYKKTITKQNGVIEVEEGLAYTSEIEQDNEKFTPVKRGEKEYLFAVSKDFHEKSKKLTFKVDISKQLEMIDETPYSTLNKTGELTFVYFNHYSGFASDLNGDVVVMLVKFDYMDGLDNGSYNLEYVIDKLKEKGERVSPVSGNSKIQISEIPYYNATEETDKQIEILYLPTKEEMNYLTANRWEKKKVLMRLFGI